MKIHAVMRMNINNNIGICPDFIRNVFDGCRDDIDDLPVFYPGINLPTCQLQEIPCLSLVLLCLELIIGFIKPLLPSDSIPTLILSSAKYFEELNDIDVRLESIICDEGKPLQEVTNNL